MQRSRTPHIPSLTIGMSLLLLIGWTFQPSRDVLYLMAFVLMAVVADMTYRRMDDQGESSG